MAGNALRVERPQVEVDHDARIGPIGARMQCPVVQQEAVVAIDRHFFAVLRMDDEHAHHAESHLRHLVGMRVIHVRAVLLQGELVDIGLAGLDRGWFMPLMPSNPFGRSMPCQCTEVASGRRLVTNSRTRSPSTASRVGPGVVPL